MSSLDQLAAELSEDPAGLGPMAVKAEEYAAWARRTGLAGSSARIYARQVRAFAAWADSHGPEYAEALTDHNVRDYAIKDYRRHLLTMVNPRTGKKLAPATVASAMSALGSFTTWAGIGRTEGVGVSVPPQGKRGLPKDELRRILRAAQRKGPRDYALLWAFYGCAIRVSEAHALDLDDVVMTERTGVLHVRHGKGGKPRDVPINADTRDAFRGWLEVRPQVDHPAFFIARGGRRMSVRSMERRFEVLRGELGLKATPHTMRHTHGRQHVENGGDLVILRDNLGHGSIQTTAIYANPTEQDRIDAVERITIDL